MEICLFFTKQFNLMKTLEWAYIVAYLKKILEQEMPSKMTVIGLITKSNSW